MEKKSLNTLKNSDKNTPITYTVSMKVQQQPSVDLYTLNSLDDAIKAALSVYANIPTFMQVTLIDSTGVTHLIMNRYA